MSGGVTRRGALGVMAGALATPALGQGEDMAARLARVFHDSDEDQLRLTPQAATLRGDLRYLAQFGDLVSDDFQRQYRAYIARDLARIGRVDRTRLNATGQLEYDVFSYQTEFARQAYDSGAAQVNNQDFALDHLNGQQMAFPQFMAHGGGFPYADMAAYEAALHLHEGFASFLGRAEGTMRRGAARGNVHIRIVAERMIGQMRDAVAAGVDGSPFLTPTAHFPDSVAAADRARLTGAFRTSIERHILPAFVRLKGFLEDWYLPRTRTGAPGLVSLHDGRALYAYFLELFTTTRIGAAEIHALGLSEVARLNGEMDAVRRQVGFDGTVRQFLTSVKEDPRFRFATREAYLAAFEGISQRVSERLPRYFHQSPRAPLQIRPVPAEMESATSGAYYILGTPDGSRPGMFYVNLSNLPTRTSPITTALYLHEAVPGHHFQGSLAQENTALPPFLRFLWNSGYVEGWGLYCERLGDEMGLYEDPYQRLGMLDLQMFRAVRLVVDTGLHAQGWSRQRAIDYMNERTTMGTETVTLEIDRYIVTPGQAVSYKVGEQVLLGLRREAEQALGPRFDVRDFHEQVLNSGSLPLAVLQAKLRRWIAGGGGRPGG